MPYNTDERAYLGQAMRGCGALYDMLDQIGGNSDDKPDQKVAKLLVDHEMPLRALLTYALGHLTEEH